MKRLWTQDSVDHDGEFWQLSGATMSPKPFQKPHPPLWIGGSGPNALRRAVTYGAGFFGAGSMSTASFADQVRYVRSVPGGESAPIAKRVYISVDDDATRARERVDADLTALYGRLTEEVAAAAIAGTVADCVRQVREVIDAGAELVLFTPLSRESEHAELIAAELIPRL